MKSRILTVLLQLSQGTLEEPALSMSKSFQEELKLEAPVVQQRAQKVLKHLLNNYALFSVETIDHFNHRLLRTFSRDLGLNSNFEVSLDTPLLLSEAVDQLIALAGEDPEITKWLVQFALQKTEEDKSWDISRDLSNAAKLLTQENDLVHLEKLRDKDLGDFDRLKKKVITSIQNFEKALIDKSIALLKTFEENGLDASHFDGRHLYKFFEKTAAGNTSLNLETQWQKKVGAERLYPNRVANSAEADSIERITPQIKELLDWIRVEYPNYLKNKNALSQLIPLATVHLIDQQLQEVKTTYNLLPISEFNSLIHKEIKNQPAPFIYERLGERYRHYFIDEFQDTSLLQWGNLKPLVENALAQAEHKGEASLMIVGDAKQSIYRWRGGLPEQFIELYSPKNPFPFVEKTTLNLGKNYRSCREIIHFNNRFFSYLSKHFNDEEHQRLYREGSHQEIHHDCQGYVQLEFLDSADAEETMTIHPEAVLKQIQSLLERGFKPGDLCVLTRKKKEGIAVSEVLASAGFKVVSEETLLLKNAPTVSVLIDLLQLSLNPKDDEAKVRILEFVAEKLEQESSLYSWAKEAIGHPLKVFEQILETAGMKIRFKKTFSLGVFEALEYFVKALHLNDAPDAYLVFFMDWVYQFSQNPKNSKSELMDYWELKKDDLSIAAPNNGEAVRVMTVHKSKGLQFPVVLFPFAHLDIYREKDPQVWYPWHADGFDELLLSYKQEIATYDTTGEQLYHEHRNKLQLDNLNLLYVALTRAQQELYIFSGNKFSANEPRSYSDFFQGFLDEKGAWDATQQCFHFGKQEPPQFIGSTSIAAEELEYPISLPEDLGLKIVGQTHRPTEGVGEEARAFGTVFHEFMETIKTREDIDYAWSDINTRYPQLSNLLSSLPKTIHLLVENELLKDLYNTEETILVEKDIITPNGVVRPDRLNLHEDGSVTLVDYKTGIPRESHEYQMKSYAEALEAMGFSLRNCFLVYVQPQEILVNKVYL